MDGILYDIMKIYLAQMDSAIKISEIICKHSDREELSGDDIICGLIFRLMRPMNDNEIEKSLNKASSILNDEYNSEDEEEDMTINYEIPKISRKIRRPVWRIDHGDEDNVVPIIHSKLMYEAMKKQKIDVVFNIHKGVNHNSWENVFDDPKFIPWLFRQTK